MSYGLPDFITDNNPIAGNIKGVYHLATGHPGQAFNDMANGQTFGLYGAAKDALNKPYDDAANADVAAGQQSEALGNKALDIANAGTGRALDQTTPAARYFSQNYEGGGELAGPGNTQQLYDQRAGGYNPALEYDRSQGQNAIDNAFASRGLQNSGAALQAGANMNASISAENQRQLGDLAKSADTMEQSRVGGALDFLGNLGNNRANIVQHGTDTGLNDYTAGMLGGINSKLAASQVGVNQQKDYMNAGGQLFGPVLKSAFG